MTVGQLIEQMDSVEFFHWRALSEIEADEAERAERGEPLPAEPKKLVSDPAEIRRWFSQHGGGQ